MFSPKHWSMPLHIAGIRQRLSWLVQRLPPRTLRLIGLGLNIALILLVGLVIHKHQELLPILGQSLSPQILLACLFLYLSSLFIQAIIWIDMMGYHKNEYTVAIEDYIQTNLMSRLPGGIWKLIGRMTIYRAPRLSARMVLMINLFELLLLILSASLIIGLLFLTLLWQLLVVMIITAVLFWSTYRFRSMIPGLQRSSAVLRALIWLTGHLCCWLIGGTLAYLLFIPFVSINFFDLLLPFTISGVISLLLQFLPINLLFRDLTLMALLTPFMTPSQALIAVFALRIVLSVSELLSSWIIIGIARFLPAFTSEFEITPDRPVQNHPPR